MSKAVCWWCTAVNKLFMSSSIFSLLIQSDLFQLLGKQRACWVKPKRLYQLCSHQSESIKSILWVFENYSFCIIMLISFFKLHIDILSKKPIPVLKLGLIFRNKLHNFYCKESNSNSHLFARYSFCLDVLIILTRLLKHLYLKCLNNSFSSVSSITFLND